MEFLVLEELKSYITPLSGEEKFTLKQSILEEGCRDPLILWNKGGTEKILIDGHNRHSICTEFNIKYNTTELDFKNIEEVKDWMVDNQLGRRNLNPDQLSYYRGLKYDRLKKKKGGFDKVLSKGKEAPLTSEILAKEFNVSEKTIKRDSQFSRGIDVIGSKNPDLKVQILTGAAKVKKSDIQLLGSTAKPPNKKYKNLADLQNMIANLKRNIFNTSHAEELANQAQKLEEAKQYLKEKDLLFKTKEQRIERAKANLISQINQCIEKENNASFVELQRQVKKFKELILNE